MTKAANSAPQPTTIILFGLSPIGKARAGSFKGSDVPAARKAAAKIGLNVLNITDGAVEVETLARKVPAGRIHGHGQAVVPFVPKAVYEAITNLARPNSSAETAKTAEPRLPANWEDIEVGDRVLAQDTDPKDGWWQVLVIGKNGDQFKLRWPSGAGRPFQRHRLTLGLVCPIKNLAGSQNELTKPSAAEPSRYPRDWAAIGAGQIVLAKEDGPCEQWWAATTAKREGDLFTLNWLDKPKLPSIVRSRFELGLVHPAPKAR